MQEFSFKGDKESSGYRCMTSTVKQQNSRRFVKQHSELVFRTIKMESVRQSFENNV